MNDLNYCEVKNVYSNGLFEDALNCFRPIIEEWKDEIKENAYSRERVSIVSSLDSKVNQFTEFFFTKDHKLDSIAIQSKKILFQKDFYSSSISIEKKQKFLEVARKVITTALERFAFEQKLTGNQYIRIQLKTFFYGLKEPLKEPKQLKLKLGWHYDFCAKKSFVSPIMDEFRNEDPGSLKFAINGYKGKCNAYKKADHNQVEPLPETVVEIPYPKQGALMFDGFQGRQLHSPTEIELPKDKTGVLSRTLLQIVLTSAKI